MTPKPLLLDLFCCAGGAGMGYHRAGFEVIGVDINPQPNYPFEFHQADAIKFVTSHGREFDAIHASQPCQAGCTLTAGTNNGRTYPQLIPATRDALIRIGRPWVIENVAGAPIRKDLMLCGEMFGLAVIRHRFFELDGWTITQPPHPKHRGRVAGMRHGQWFEGPYFAVYGEGGGKGTVPQWQQAMGITWTDVRKEIAEAIPPAFTELIGSALMATLTAPMEIAA
ncbi:DNA methylase [Saccharopolyspora sp. NPDC050642]|uniref:DNA methylase n=1 Tax=Saccharopolyspora sp. NPDC050642 TaxID=3157099 RepID=UPI00340E34DB